MKICFFLWRLLLIFVFIYAIIKKFESIDERLKMQLLTGTDARPLEWSTGRQYEGEMRTYIVKWMEANPAIDGESRETTAYKTILDRIVSNLDRSSVTSPRTVSIEYSTVWNTIVRAEQLSEDTQEYSDWQVALDAQWSQLVAFVANNFLKQTPPPLSTPESSPTASAWS